jgi:hypothetical protein
LLPVGGEKARILGRWRAPRNPRVYFSGATAAAYLCRPAGNSGLLVVSSTMKNTGAAPVFLL